MIISIVLVSAFVLDFFCGDPRWIPHPVRGIGKLCTFLDRSMRNASGLLGLRICGLISFCIVILVTIISILGLFHVLQTIFPPAVPVIAVLLLYMGIATGDLLKHSRRVASRLTADDTQGARNAVAMLVGRETSRLDNSEVSRACIESVSENLVDGVTAPLFWAFAFALGSLSFSASPSVYAVVGMFGYKAINTMDSMFGYKNDKYLDFGRAAAKADDFVNFIPARLSGLCIIAVSCMKGFSCSGAVKAYFNDRMKSSSPNSGHTEAATAGSLGIQLGGDSVYFGIHCEKPYIGEGLRKPEVGDIGRANTLVTGAAILFLCLMVAFTGISVTWIL